MARLVESLEASSNDDIQVVDDTTRVNLTCPISLVRIQTPVRGEACAHIQVRAGVRTAEGRLRAAEGGRGG